ncbi:MAG TPA: peptidoglycan-binding protein [Actinocrinis sp.]|nr:peptidoglycan-binding protein [Actinocrinis sp.]
MEPTHADHASGRIPPQAAAPTPEQSAAQASAFRRTLDEQTTSHDETIVMPPVPGGLPAVIPVPPPPRERAVRLIDAQQQYRQRAAGPGARPDPTAVLAVPPSPGIAAPRNPRELREHPGQGLAGPSAREVASARTVPSRELDRVDAGRGLLAADGSGDSPPAERKRHSAGNRPGRLPAMIGVCATLAMIGGLILILTNGGLSPNPTAPAALPGLPTTQLIVIAGGTGNGSLGGSASPQATPSATATPTPSARPTAPAGSAPATGKPVTAPAAPPTHASPSASATASAAFQTLSEGSSGQAVAQLQARLQQYGFLISYQGRYVSICARNGLDASGSDEQQTTDAVYQFQRNYDDFMGGNLQANGVCNYATWQALFGAAVRAKDCYGSP